MKMRNFQRIKAMGGDIPAARAFSRKQAVFNEKAGMYARQGVITTPGYLRLEALAPNSAVSTFNFQTLQTSGVQTPTERRLKLADTFTITDISFYLGLAAATAHIPSADQYAQATLNTFANPDTALFGANATALEAIYNGYITLRIDTTTFLDSIPVRQFYRVATSQQQTLGANSPQIHKNEWPLSLYGKTELLPTIELNGQSNIEWSLNLPTATNCAITGGTKAVIPTIILTGFLNQGAATVQRGVQKQLR